LSDDNETRIDALFITDLTTLHTRWNQLKADAANPTLTHLRDLVARHRWLVSQRVGAEALASIRLIKVRHFADEVRALDAARMQALEPHKRLTLAVALLTTESASALDDLGEMFVRRLQHIHNAAKLALDRYRAATVERTDKLVTTLHELLLAHQVEGSAVARFLAMDAVIAPRKDELLEACEAHLVHAGSNYSPFVWRAYKSHRASGLHARTTVCSCRRTFPTRSDRSAAATGSECRSRCRRAGRNAFNRSRSARVSAYGTAALRSPSRPERLALLGELRHAIDNDELVLHFQPKISLSTGRVIGVEALVRWQHSQRGLMAPDQFIGLAEQTGVIRPLSRWVLNETLRQWSAWRRAGIDVSMAVNLSVRDLHDPDLPQIVGDLLARWRAVPSDLVLEITENGLMAEPARALDTATRLRALGARLAIDDFGTGYSSLAYLKRLPVSELKIDRSFVRDIAVDEDDATIVRSTIGLAHDLGLNVVAEGIEDQASYDVLTRLGCDVGQGYFISRPLPAPDFEAWFSAHDQDVDLTLAA